jgi:hypothetical protein
MKLCWRCNVTVYSYRAVIVDIVYRLQFLCYGVSKTRSVIERSFFYGVVLNSRFYFNQRNVLHGKYFKMAIVQSNSTF